MTTLRRHQQIFKKKFRKMRIREAIRRRRQLAEKTR